MSDENKKTSGPDVTPIGQRSPPPIPDHELIRCIGYGACGAVWLARSIMGTYRAVKVVYRDSFDHERPFEREFNGIQKFEPISRSHESQVDILHVGRTENCFYYVMELADDQDTGQEINPDTYTSKTLRSELFRRGKLPFEECLQISLALTTALEHLHEHGLVHRDIKPANIIFVHGIPRLADIGLVASVDATRSYVGTEGFFPPEGPGTAQADIYSFGKVLYEMTSGRDRQDFPELPTNLAELPDRAGMLELNAIISKACKNDPRQRYQSAEEMHADLVLLQSGKSVRRVRTLERRLARATKTGIAIAAVGVVLAGAFLLQKHQTNEAKRLAADNRQLADESREHLVRLQVLSGNHLLEQGDDVAASLWFAEGLRAVKGNPQQERIQRLRLEWLLRDCPRLAQVFVHTGTVFSCKFSPDGNRIVTASSDGTAQVWDANTGVRVTPPLKHKNFVNFATFSPDGKSILTASADRTAQLWNSTNGKPLTPALQHEKFVTGASFNSRGDRILTFSSDGTARVWRASTGEPLASLKHNGAVLCAVFSGDDRLVATGSADKTAQIWDANTGLPLLSSPLSHPDPVGFVSFDSDGRRLLAGTGGSQARSPTSVFLWNVESGQMIRGPLLYPGRLRFIGFAGEPTRIVGGGSGDGGVLLWNPETGASATTQISQKGPEHIAFSPDKLTAITAAEANGAAYIWNLHTGERIFSPLKHGGQVLHADFSPDGQRVVTASSDGVAKAWNLTTGTGSLMLRHNSKVVSACFSPDGSKILTAGLDGTAKLWNSTNGKLLLPPMENPNQVALAMFSANGKRMLTAPRMYAGNGGTSILMGTKACVWDAMTGQLVGKPLMHRTNISAAAISSDGHWAITAGGDGSIQAWDADTGVPVGGVFRHSSIVSHVAFSPDQQHVLASSWDTTAGVWNWKNGTLAFPLLKHQGRVEYATYSFDGQRIITFAGLGRIWDARSGKPVGSEFEAHGSIWYAAFSPDGRHVAQCGASPRMRICDTTTGEQVVATIESPASVMFAQFSPDGRMLVIASDNTARVWDATTGEPISPPLRHGDTVHQVWFSPDGQRLLTASADGTARVWNVPNNASSDDLILLAEVTAGRTYNTSGAFVTQKPETLYAALQNLRTKYPAQFSISAEDGLSWHRVQAVDAETSRRWPTAIWHLKHLIEKQPDSDELRRSRGIALAESGRWREAKDDFAEIVRHGTRDYHDYANLAFIHLALGEHDEYGQVCTELIDRFGNTNHALTAMDVASYCVHARNTNSSRARALAEAAVSLWPGRYYLYTLGAAYYRVGRYQDALEQFRLARSQGDGGAFYYLFEAMAQFQLGNKVEAQTLLQKAEQSIDERIGPGADEKIRSTVTWKEKLRLTLLRREAEALIAPKQIPGKELGVPGFP